MADYTVKKGDTGPVIEVGSPSMTNPAVNWTCNLRVLNAAGAALINRAVTDISGAKFVAYLTPAETATLAVETYRLVIELANATLTPPFNVEEQHTLSIDPEMPVSSATGLVAMTKGTNSFDTYESLLLRAGQHPELTRLLAVDRAELKTALLGAYRNIGCLDVDFGVTDATTGEAVTSSADFSQTDLEALDARAFDALCRAQLIEANGLLGGNPVTDRRKLGLISDSVGESAHFFRTAKPLEIPVYRETLMALRGYVTWTKRISR